MRIWLVATLCATSILAVPAAAVTYRFDIVDPDARQNGEALTGNSYFFLLDSMPTPSASGPLFFVVPATVIYSTPTFGNDAVIDDITFYAEDFFGGLQTTFNLYAGEQLFTGTTANPTFRLGTFQLDNLGSGATLTVSVDGGTGVPGVPEAATWAMMVAGFGLVGAGLRARRPVVTYA